LWRQTMGMGGGWIVEVDIRKFFDTLDHAQLRELLRQRIRDGPILQNARVEPFADQSQHHSVYGIGQFFSDLPEESEG